MRLANSTARMPWSPTCVRLCLVIALLVPLAGYAQTMPGQLNQLDFEPAMTQALRGYDGSLVIIDLSNGKEYAVGPHIYEPQGPASTFKLITSYYLMANGRYRPGECLDCTPFSLGHRRYRCWNRKGHGETEVTKALAVSCNGFFFASFDHDTVLGTVELALRSGYTFVEGESPRLAPDVLIHGDGLKITPVDQARLIAGIVPGVHSPNVKGPPVPFTDPVALAEIRRGMEAAVTDGSGKICRIAGFPVAGKTGSWKGSRWFACYAPADNPRFVVVAYTKGGSIHGGVEVCRRFFLSYLHGQGITVASGRKSRRHRLR